MFHRFFSSLPRSKYLFLFSFSLIFWLSLLAMKLVICLSFKVPENFVSLILQYGFQFLHILFGSMVKFKFLAQFQIDHLLHPVVSCLVLNSFCASFLHSLIMWLIVILYLNLPYFRFKIAEPCHCFMLLLEEIQFLS